MTHGFCPRGRRKARSCTTFAFLCSHRSLVSLDAEWAGGRAGLGDPPRPAPSLPVPPTPATHNEVPTPGIRRGPRRSRSNTLATPKLTHSGQRRGDPATHTARGAALDPVPSQTQAGRRALILSPRRASVPRPPGPLTRAAHSRSALSPGGLKPRHPLNPGPYLKTDGWAARSAPRLDRPSSQGAGSPVQSPASRLPPRSRLHAPSGCTSRTGPLPRPLRRTVPCLHAPARVRVLTQHAHTACTCDVRTGSHAAHAHRVHMRRAHRSSLSRHVPRALAMWALVLPARAHTACTCDVHTGLHAERLHTRRAHTSINTPLHTAHTLRVIHIGRSFSHSV